MTLRPKTQAIAPALGVLLLLVASSPCRGVETGRWHLPSNVAQYFGVGYGPGYHAPMIRSPGYDAMPVQRLKFVSPECSPFGCADFRPAYLWSDCGWSGCGATQPYGCGGRGCNPGVLAEPVGGAAEPTVVPRNEMEDSAAIQPRVQWWR